MKKLITMLLMLALVATTLTALAEPALKLSEIGTEPGTYPLVTEPITVNVFAPQSAEIENITTNKFTIEYEAKTGVHIEWELVPSNALAEKKSLSLASGDYPDMYVGSGITREEASMYGPAGVFVSLNDYVDNIMPNFWTMVEAKGSYPNLKQLLMAGDGQIYSLPQVSSSIHTKYRRKMWVNSYFVDQLGLDMPVTTEDFYNMLKAFKEGDPNGNGKADEIPLVIANTDMASFIMNAFVYDGPEHIVVSDDYQLSFAFTTDAWREGLRYLHRLWQDGLLDYTSFATNNEQIKQLAEYESAEILGACAEGYPSAFSNIVGERYRHFYGIDPLIGPEGEQNAWYDPINFNYGTAVITRNCEYPDIMARWVDGLYDYDTALRAREGEEGIDWIVPPEGTISYAGLPATWERAEQYGLQQNNKWNGLAFPHNMTMHILQSGTDDLYSAAGLESLLYEATTRYMPYAPKNVLVPLFIDLDVISEYSRAKTDIQNYVSESMVRFINGDLDLDSDWDGYLAVFAGMGVDTYLSASQDAYNVYLKNIGAIE